MVRAALALVVVAGCATSPCKKGTVFISYTLSAAADEIDVQLSIDGGAAQTRALPRKPGDSSIEVDFGAYPAGRSLAFTLTARQAGGVVASTTQTMTAAAGCTSLSFTFSSTPDLAVTVDGGNVDGGDDLAVGVDGGSDLAPSHDLSFVPGPSCAGLAASCGVGGNDNCCSSLLVPGGTFYRSYDQADGGTPDFPARVYDFRLDKYEVTVGRFRAFVLAQKGTQQNPPTGGDGANPHVTGSGWNPNDTPSLPASSSALRSDITCAGSADAMWTDSPGANENKPINCITWYEAFAFCAWDGGFLPTEAEWNYAAAGGNEQRAYPWSAPPSSTTIDSSYATYNCFVGGKTCITAAGSHPKGVGKWGHLDLGGNLFEWTLDFAASVYPLPCDDCAALMTTPSTTNRENRGGAFDQTDPATLRTGSRDVTDEGAHVVSTGVRCARAP